MDFKQFLSSLRHLNTIAYNASLVDGLIVAKDELKEENIRLHARIDELSERCSRQEERHKIIRSGFRRQKNLPIRVVFLCENPEMWKAFRGIVYEMEADPRFEVILVRLRCRGLRKGWMDEFNFPDYESVDPVCAAKMIDAYDEETGTWLDIETLHPEYVFYMRPYESCRHELHRIARVSQFAKTCYVPYGIQLICGKIEGIVFPEEFCSLLDFFFLTSRFERNSVQNAIKHSSQRKKHRVEYCGYVGLDRFKQSLPEEKHDRFTICWLPRWNTHENTCHFFEYNDILLSNVKSHEKTYLIMRPHPKCFDYFVKMS